jgi:FKBP-type peptidyl-prolyl cis-trans isomerase
MKLLFAVLPIAACACFAIAQDTAAPATQPATQPSTMPAHVTDASYGVGYGFGKQLAGAPVKLDNERVLQGLRDALDNKQAAVDEKTVNAALMRIQQEAMAAEMAAGKVEGEKNAAAGDAFRAENGKKEGVTTTASGLQIQHVKEGTGESPKATDTVKVHYTGTLIDGTKFDSSAGGPPATFPVDKVIKGWTEALQLMKVGGKARLVVPPTIGYGPMGNDPIPPNATLVFDVELVDIVKK